MYRKLSDFAEIFTGYTFREGIEPQIDGGVLVVQAKNISSNTLSDLKELTSIENTFFKKDIFLRKKDILLISKVIDSKSFRSTVFLSESDNVIPSSSIHIIRVTDDTILPEYVQIFLNSPQGQKLISEKVSGAYIKTISKSALLNIEIPIASIEKQKTIIALHRNIQEQEILHCKKIYHLKNIQQGLFNKNNI